MAEGREEGKNTTGRSTARENITQGGQSAERGSNAAREAVNQAGAAVERTGAEARTVAGQVGEVARDASGRAREAAERITEQTKETTEQAARQAREINENFADSLARTTDDLAVNTTERAAEQGREVAWQSVRAAAGMQTRLTDARNAEEVAEEILQNTIGSEIDGILSRLEASIPEERRAMNAVMSRLIRG
jgi:hypothetical protein